MLTPSVVKYGSVNDRLPLWRTLLRDRFRLADLPVPNRLSCDTPAASTMPSSCDQPILAFRLPVERSFTTTFMSTCCSFSGTVAMLACTSSK